jgi:hypothetical protein
VSRPNAGERIDNARATLELLFPGRDVRVGRPASRGSDSLIFSVAPSARRPLVLVPSTPRSAARTVMRCYGPALGRSARLASTAIGVALSAAGRGGLGQRLLVTAGRDGAEAGINDHLSRVLGAEVSVSLQLSAARANRKPVLQAIAAGRSTPLAFVKVGTNPLTRELVTREATALRDVAARGPDAVTVPAVLDLSDFAGLTVLALEPLPTWERGGQPDRLRLEAAATAIADIAPTPAGPLAGLPLWPRLRDQLEAMAETPNRSRLVAAHDELGRRAQEIPLRGGASHGDWSPWNLRQVGTRLLAWDWERYDVGIPSGSDLVHYRLMQLLIGEGVDPSLAARTIVDESPELLAAVVPDERAARVTALSHLMMLAVRYEAEGQAAAGARLGQIQDWLVPELESGISRLGHP